MWTAITYSEDFFSWYTIPKNPVKYEFSAIYSLKKKCPTFILSNFCKILYKELVQRLNNNVILKGFCQVLIHIWWKEPQVSCIGPIQILVIIDKYSAANDPNLANVS